MPLMTIPATLFHGTNTDAFEFILQEGLKPRGATRESNWGKNPSLTDRVYLTSTYGVHYASCQRAVGEPLLLVIDTSKLDPALFVHDEDLFLVNSNPARRLMSPLDGLAAMGTIGYAGTVPPSAITAYMVSGEVIEALEDAREEFHRFDHVADPYFRVYGAAHRELQRLVIEEGEVVDAACYGMVA